MKIGGLEVSGPAEEVLVLPRLDNDIIIRTEAVLDMSPFEALCPVPSAPTKLKPGGFTKDIENTGYIEQTKRHGDLRFAFICVTSLVPSEIEWEDVDLGVPDTWLKWDQELTKAGFSSVELNRVVMCIMQANSLDENKLKEARELFLHGQVEGAPKSSGPSTEPGNTQSGEPVNASA